MIRNIDSVADLFLATNPQTVDRGAVRNEVAVLALGLVKPIGTTGKIQVFDATTQRLRDIAASDLPGNVFEKITAVTPLTGATVTANTTGADELIYITPAGTIAALTFVFPSDANSALGQTLTILSHQTVTALTVTSTALTLNGTAATAMQADVPIRWRKVASSTWSREDATLTATGVVLTSAVITTGLTASGSASNDFSASTGTFKTSTGLLILGGGYQASVQALSGAGAVNVTTEVTRLTTTGASQALTLADGAAGQRKTIIHEVDGGSAILTPTTKTGFTTITFTAVGDAVTLVFFTTRGWMIQSLNGAVAA